MNLKALSTLAMGTVLLVGCQEDNLGVQQQEVFTTAYDRNFTNKFGDVNPNETWDFTTRALTQYTSIANEGDYYHVPNTWIHWLQQHLPEGQSPLDIETKAFSMVAHPNEIFEIAPIYLGKSWMDWNLNMVVELEDGTHESITIWTKQNHGIQTSSNGTKWGDFSVGANGGNGSTHDSNVQELRVKPVLVDLSTIPNLKENSIVYFTINIVSGHSGMGKRGDVTTSISNPTNMVSFSNSNFVIEGRNDIDVMMIGVDEESINPDHDYNDIVFLVAGFIPQVIKDDVIQDVPLKKRYMCEDLTNVGDYDFNDIVVDLTQVTRAKYQVDTETGEITEDRSYAKKVTQYAELTYLCGTVPSQVYLGDTPLFNKVTNPTDATQTLAELAGTFTGTPTTWWENTLDERGLTTGATKGSLNPEDEVSLGWNPDANNIRIVVWPSKEAATGISSTDAWIATFPERGAVPFIIATSPNFTWKAEGEDIDAAWWAALGAAKVSQ